MASALTLRAHYARRDTNGLDPATIDWFGTFALELEIPEATDFPAGSRLAMWCTMLLDVGLGSNARIVDRLSGHVELESLDHQSIDRTGRWTIEGLRSSFPARHANDGPEGAYVILPDGRTRTVDVIPATTADPPRRRTAPREPLHDLSDRPPVVPFPTRVDVPAPRVTSGALRLASASEGHEASWNAVVALASRLGCGEVFDDYPTRGPADARAFPAREVQLRVDPTIGSEAYRTEITDRRIEVVGGDADGVRHGLITLAQWAGSGLPTSATVDDRPALPARIVHLDLARRWYEPDIVGRLIDLAAWRKFNRVHLHLTDDEAWRFPVPEYPTLSTVGGTRGHGLPIGPLVASGPDPYGRAYTNDEIAAWVARADDLGVTLVPEVDVPGHCFAALTAVPELRDPHDTSHARSVQGFVDNVLVPGNPATMVFLEAVFGALAELFPNSPWLHIGGDEVPDGAWAGSPLVTAYAARHDLAGKRDIETHFHRDVIEMIRETTGRDVAMWEEAALAGLDPAGYAVAWTSAAAGQRLVEAGHAVVMSPGQAYYLDMAPDRDWSTPGTTWAGTATLEATCDFDPLLGIDASLPGAVVGVQACIWSEHIASTDILDRLVFPRLDAIAERGWTGEIVDGPEGLSRRSAALARFTSPG